MLSNSITYILLDYAHFLGYIKEKYANKTQTVSEKTSLKWPKMTLIYCLKTITSF